MIEAIVPVLVGGLLAIAGGGMAQFLSHELSVRHESRSLAKAFRGEIGAILHIIDKRAYLQHMESMADQLEAVNATAPFALRVTHNYFEVYESNCSKIGLLRGDAPMHLARFYILAKSLLEDVSVTEQSQQASQYDHHALYEMRDLLKELIGVGEKLVDELEK